MLIKLVIFMPLTPIPPTVMFIIQLDHPIPHYSLSNI